MIGTKTYKLKVNRRTRTYTIHVYEGGRLVAKYRSFPQGRDFSEDWTESDIYWFLRLSADYYIVK